WSKVGHRIPGWGPPRSRWPPFRGSCSPASPWWLGPSRTGTPGGRG
ncbi:MAG: hypothetical protein AVDCRST_MAG05-4952, partial [uncultured Rubrobacteraceae bacterium]